MLNKPFNVQTCHTLYFIDILSLLIFRNTAPVYILDKLAKVCLKKIIEKLRFGSYKVKTTKISILLKKMRKKFEGVGKINGISLQTLQFYLGCS